ncbi:MAG: phage tail assembly protein [Porticoccaceae bacterium]
MADTVKPQTPDRIKITLDRPVDMDGAQVSVLHMRRGKVRDQIAAQRQANNDPAMTEVCMFALLCEIAPSNLEDMDLADYEKLRETFAGFRTGLSPKKS